MTINVEDLNNKLKEKLKTTGWYEPLRLFIQSEGLIRILDKLVEEKKDGFSFTPVLKQLFRAFEECPYDKFKVLILSQDPYPGTGKSDNGLTTVADGIAFSCSNTNNAQPSLKILQNSWEQVSAGERNKDLTYLSNQGVLLLNAALTTRVGEIGKHLDIWKPFITYLFDYLNNYNRGIVYLFLGQVAQKYSPYISDHTNYKLTENHPSFYARSQASMPADIWVKTNEILLKNYNTKIEWLYNLTDLPTLVG